MVAPSDIMDAGVRHTRKALDKSAFTDVGILAYSTKYCSSFYGPFPDALGSASRGDDKKTYQTDPANVREALREVHLGLAKGLVLFRSNQGCLILILFELLKKN